MRLSIAGLMFVLGLFFYILGSMMEIVFRVPRRRGGAK